MTDDLDALRRELQTAKADLAHAVQWCPQWKVKQHRLYVLKLELELTARIGRENDENNQSH